MPWMRKDYFLNFQLPAGTPLQSKNRLRRNQFGTWLAGPVLLPGYKGKDKTFWSFNYEGTRETQESVQQAFWYPQSFRNGDFSELLRPLIRNGVPVRAPTIIYDPITGEPFRDSRRQYHQHHPAQPHQQERSELHQQLPAAASIRARRTFSIST